MSGPIRMDLVRAMLLPERRAELNLAHRMAHPELKPEPRGGLTARQRQLVDFIATHVAEHRVTPSFEEMAAALGLKSKSGIHRYVTALGERGYVERGGYGSARSIKLLGAA